MAEGERPKGGGEWEPGPGSRNATWGATARSGRSLEKIQQELEALGECPLRVNQQLRLMWIPKVAFPPSATPDDKPPKLRKPALLETQVS